MPLYHFGFGLGLITLQPTLLRRLKWTLHALSRKFQKKKNHIHYLHCKYITMRKFHLLHIILQVTLFTSTNLNWTFMIYILSPLKNILYNINTWYVHTYTQLYCHEISMKISNKNGRHTPINEKYARYVQFTTTTSTFTAKNKRGNKT